MYYLLVENKEDGEKVKGILESAGYSDLKVIVGVVGEVKRVESGDAVELESQEESTGASGLAADEQEAEYNVKVSRQETSGINKKLKVQCFGNFEVFDMQNKPLKFARKKSKELFAYMIDRSGALIDIDQIRTILWEESEDLDVKKSYTRTLLADIRKTLAAAGCQDALINRRNDYGLEMSKISCDYFDFLYAVKHPATDDEKQKSANRAAIALFNGEYMSQYSWAEGTLGLLSRMAKKYK